ncbi:LytR/AlgR family response regulator transcription factor [Lactococcus nasutitermitis]|uniref:LytR/AlgR family response regulator transcription factor n=1 Tax=Lactococcus nasutitermitis TaxID=1652957 RepID=A0ABV9JCY0_9LACT|nr:LytTR family DNA-binding domain-containing protein [Lactococcus nasutitermitis]
MKFRKEINPNLTETEIFVKTYDEKIFDRIVKKFDENLTVKTTDGLRVLKRSEVIYVESLRNYLEIYTDNEFLTVRLPLYKMKELLGADFVQVARSYLINFERLKSVEADLVNGMVARVERFKVPISQSYLKNIYKKIEEKEVEM